MHTHRDIYTEIHYVGAQVEASRKERESKEIPKMMEDRRARTEGIEKVERSGLWQRQEAEKVKV